MKFEQCKSGAVITVHSGGPRGPKGEQGPKGDKGEQGIQGEVGPKGDTGEVTQEEFDDLKDQVALDKLDYTERLESELGDSHIIRELPNGVRDEFGNSQVIKNTGKVVIDGSNISGFNGNTNRCRVQINNWISSNNTLKGTDNIVAFNDLATFTPVGFIQNIAGYQISTTTDDNLYIGIDAEYINANYSANITGIKNYLNDHPITLIYQLLISATISLPEDMTPNTREIVRLRDNVNDINEDIKIVKLSNYKPTTIYPSATNKKMWINFEDSLWEASGEGKVIEDINNVRYGSRSMKIIKTDSGYTYARHEFPSIDLSKKLIMLNVYISDVSLHDIIRVTLRTSGLNWANGIIAQYNMDKPNYRRLQNGWNTIILRKSEVSAVGTATLNDINKVTGLQITLSGTNEINASISVDAIFLIDEIIDNKPYCTITFDDGYISDYTYGKKIMSEYGYMGTSYIVPSIIGNTNRLTLDHLKEMYEMGWDISNHTFNHTYLTSENLVEWVADMKAGYNWLIENGFKRTAEHVAYPGGYNSLESRWEVSKYSKTGRINTGGTGESLPCASPYQIYALSGAASITTLKATIDTLAERGQWLVLMFHEISDTNTSSGSCTPQHFREVIEYLHTKQIKVLPMSSMTN